MLVRTRLDLCTFLVFPFASLPGLSKDPQTTGREREHRTSGSEGEEHQGQQEEGSTESELEPKTESALSSQDTHMTNITLRGLSSWEEKPCPLLLLN